MFSCSSIRSTWLPVSFFRDDEASSVPPRSLSSSKQEHPFDDLDEGIKNLIRALLREKDEACQNYAEETKKTSLLEDQLVVAEDMALTTRAQLVAADARVACKSFWSMKQLSKALNLCSWFLFFFLVLESQLQTLHAAAVTATEAVNARGDTVATHLQDVPNCVREVAGHGVQRGAAVALTMAQTSSGNDLWTLHPIFLEGEAQEVFEELADDLGVVATAIAKDVSLDSWRGG